MIWSTIAHAQTNEEITEATEAVWAVDSNRFTDDEIDYDLGNPEYVLLILCF